MAMLIYFAANALEGILCEHCYLPIEDDEDGVEIFISEEESGYYHYSCFIMTGLPLPPKKEFSRPSAKRYKARPRRQKKIKNKRYNGRSPKSQ